MKRIIALIFAVMSAVGVRAEMNRVFDDAASVEVSMFDWALDCLEDRVRIDQLMLETCTAAFEASNDGVYYPLIQPYVDYYYDEDQVVVAFWTREYRGENSAKWYEGHCRKKIQEYRRTVEMLDLRKGYQSRDFEEERLIGKIKERLCVKMIAADSQRMFFLDQNGKFVELGN